MRMFTHRMPEGAQGHFRQGWLLDWIPSNVGLAEPLVDVEFPKQYPACISTYRYGMGFHHRRVVCQCLPGCRLD